METTTSAPSLEQSPSTPRRRLAAFRVERLRVVAGLLTLFLLSAGVTYLGAWPPMATVMSGSMAPKIDTGDVVLLQRVKSAPARGDIIAVRVPDSARTRYGYPEQVIHRVVRVSPKGDLTLKGDAREKPDPFTVRASGVKAKVAFTVPGVGRVFAFLTSTLGLAWMAAGVFMFLVMPRLERQRELQESEQQTIAELREELKRISDELAGLRTADGHSPAVLACRLDALLTEAREARELLTELTGAKAAEAATASAPTVESEAVDPAASAETVESEPVDPASTADTVESPVVVLPAEPIEFERIFAPVLADTGEPEPESEPAVTTVVRRRRSGGLVGAGLAVARRRAVGRYR